MMNLRSKILGVVRLLGLMQVINAFANGWFWLLKKTSRFRNISDIDTVYRDGYFKAENDMTLPTADRVVQCLLDLFNPRSVADVGCGTGVYLREFHKQGIEIKGYEGSNYAIQAAKIDRSNIEQHDLREPLTVDKLYDIVICFEVGEHLPPNYADTLVRNITTLGAIRLFFQPLSQAKEVPITSTSSRRSTGSPNSHAPDFGMSLNAHNNCGINCDNESVSGGY